MTKQVQVSTGIVVANLLVLAITQSPVIGVTAVATITLLGFNLWLERNKLERIDSIENQIKALNDKITVMQIQRAGR